MPAVGSERHLTRRQQIAKWTVIAGVLNGANLAVGDTTWPWALILTVLLGRVLGRMAFERDLRGRASSDAERRVHYGPAS